MFCSTQLSRYELPASLRAGRQGKRRYRGSASPVCPGSHRIRSVPKSLAAGPSGLVMPISLRAGLEGMGRRSAV